MNLRKSTDQICLSNRRRPVGHWVAVAQNMIPGGHFIANGGDLFTALDADADGIVFACEYDMLDAARRNDQAELRAVLGQAMGMGQGMAKKGGMTRAFNDTDGDGLVAHDDCMAKTPEWIAMMNRNSDRAVTAGDSGPTN